MCVTEKQRQKHIDKEVAMDVMNKVLDQYSSRVYKNRKEHMVDVNHNENNVIAANVRTVPGIITQRGCCFAGCKGL